MVTLNHNIGKASLSSLQYHYIIAIENDNGIFTNQLIIKLRAKTTRLYFENSFSAFVNASLYGIAN